MSRVARVLLGVAWLCLSACSNDDSSNATPSGALSACMERPDQLPRPPTDRLPCDLIPPGLSLE